jgi:aryl-alcohol dehydrogenase-like predicted oxidoreductase
MRYVRLGKTNLEVSAVAFGTWALGGDWGAFDAQEARGAIHRALDLGITFFDTAQAYGFGVSERFLADTLWEKVGREHVVIATKGGLRMEGEKLVRDASARWLREGAESSLRNLRIEHIDLYQVHWPDEHVPADETAGVLRDLVREGKIRHVGVSNFDAQQMEEFARQGPLESLQPPYHMFHRDIEAEVLSYAAEHDIGVLVYGPLAHGLLGGRMTPETSFASDDWRSQSSDFTGERFHRNLRVVEELKQFARQRDISLSQLAVAWALAHPAVHVAIVGGRRAAQLEETAAAAEIALSDHERRKIDHILSGAASLVGPSPEGM